MNDVLPIQTAVKAAIAAANELEHKKVFSINRSMFLKHHYDRLLYLHVGTRIWWMWFRRMFLLDKDEVITHPNKILAFLGVTQRRSTYLPLNRLNNRGSGYSNAISDVDTAWLFVLVIVLIAIVVVSLIGVFA